MLWFYLIFELLALSPICEIETARILAVLPTPSISHQVVFRPLLRELDRRGHEVLVLTTDPMYRKGTTPGNLTEIDLHDMSYDIWSRLLVNKKTTTKYNFKGFDNQFNVIIETMLFVFRKQLENDEVQKLLLNKEKTFNLLFIEACFRPALLFSNFYKAPVILISSFGTLLENEATIGAPSHPILYPSVLRQRIPNLTMWETITELYAHYSLSSFYSNFEEQENRILSRQFGLELPPLNELKNNVDMLFLNVVPLWQGNHPVPPSVIYMGGIHVNPEKNLPQHLKSFMDSSKEGVIYISFGTNVQPSRLPLDKIRIFNSVLSQLPYDVLWKWDKDEFPVRSTNIRISKWFPQSDLLRHPKLKLFVTQGGLQSIDEAIVAGVPLIGIPMIGDQWYNVEKIVQHKIGIRLDMNTITQETFMEAIKTVINDKSYRRNIAKLHELKNDQNQASLERVVWWTEYILRHGSGRHIRSPAANISWFEYLEIELVSIVIIVFVLLFVVSIKAVCLVLTFINILVIKPLRRLTH